MSDWMVYAGCVVIGVLFGWGVGGGGAKVYRQLDAIEHWSGVRDALTVAAIWVLAVVIAGGAGAVYGHESTVMSNSWRVGALWGAGGGILSPSAFAPLRDAVVRAGVRLADTVKTSGPESRS